MVFIQEFEKCLTRHPSQRAAARGSAFNDRQNTMSPKLAIALSEVCTRIDEHFRLNTPTSNPGSERRLGVEGVVDLNIRGDAKPYLEVTRVFVEYEYRRQNIFRAILCRFAGQNFEYKVALSRVNDYSFRMILESMGFQSLAQEPSTYCMSTTDIRKRWGQGALPPKE